MTTRAQWRTRSTRLFFLSVLPVGLAVALVVALGGDPLEAFKGALIGSAIGTASWAIYWWRKNRQARKPSEESPVGEG